MRTRFATPMTTLATGGLLAFSLIASGCGDDDPSDNPDAGDVTDTTDPQPVTTAVEIPGADFDGSATLSGEWGDGNDWTHNTWYGTTNWALIDAPEAMLAGEGQVAHLTVTGGAYTRIATDMLLDAVEGEELTLTVDAFASVPEDDDADAFVAVGAIIALLRTEYINAGFFPSSVAQWAAADFMRLTSASGTVNGTLEASLVVPNGFSGRPVFVMLFAQTSIGSDPAIVAFDNVRLERTVYPGVDEGPALDNDGFDLVAMPEGVFTDSAPLGWLWPTDVSCGYVGAANHGATIMPQGARSGANVMDLDACPIFRAVTVPPGPSAVVVEAFFSVRADLAAPEAVAMQLLDEDEVDPAVLASADLLDEELDDTWKPLTLCRESAGDETLFIGLQHSSSGARVLVDDVTVSFRESCDN